MITVWERTKTALTSLSVPCAANKFRSDTGHELPDLFLVYQLISSPPEQHADDQETLRSYRIQVSIFSRDGLINLPDVDGAMTAAGFMKGGMSEIPLDAETGHYGLATDYLFLESED